MIFKRSRLDYGKSEAPVSPYQKAAQVWDMRLGSARVQAKNWRLMAFGSLGLAMGMAIELALMASTSRVTPYVVEVERDGGVHAVAPALKPTSHPMHRSPMNSCISSRTCAASQLTPSW